MKFAFLRNLTVALAISILIFGVILLLKYTYGDPIVWNTRLGFTFVFTLLYGISLYLANSWINHLVGYVFRNQSHSAKRFIYAFLSSLIVSLIIIFLLRILEEVVVEGVSVQQFLIEEKLSNYVFAVTITIIVSLSVHLFHFYRTVQDNKVKEQKVIAGTASAQFESLKNQIDPHFLFNSLNVLSSIIEENPGLAQQFTVDLSRIYRYVLDQKEKDLVPITEEIEFAKSYMNLLKIRFENALTFQLPSDTELQKVIDCKMVPLSLQLLLENVVKHNIITENKPITITISVQDQRLCISNNVHKKTANTLRKGVGLTNITNRYALLSNQTITLEDTPEYFTVKLPLLTKPIFTMTQTDPKFENAAYLKAQQRVKELKEFYGNLLSYCLVIPFLIFINLRYSPEFKWFWFPMLGWGMGILFHAFGTFGYGKQWEERKIQQLMDKEQQKQWK